MINRRYQFKDAIIEGGIPFNKAHGMHAFQYPAIDDRFNDVFNKGMYNSTTLIMKMVLQVYKGFEEIQEVVDVGGGFGQTLATIISKYPHIKGINFDLPHVIKDASPIAGKTYTIYYALVCSIYVCKVYDAIWKSIGVEHVGGDMFESVPKGEVIFLKVISYVYSL